MSSGNTVKALTEKRNDLVRQIEKHQAAIRQLNHDIDSIDGALRLFGAPTQATEAAFPCYRKEISRIVVGALREAGGPMTVKALADSLVDEDES